MNVTTKDGKPTITLDAKERRRFDEMSGILTTGSVLASGDLQEDCKTALPLLARILKAMTPPPASPEDAAHKDAEKQLAEQSPPKGKVPDDAA